MRRRRRDHDWPDDFDKLATYNSEVWRGIVHTPEYDARMAEVQRRYDEWSDARADEVIR